MLQIKNFVFNYFAENTILLWDDESYESAVIDPGMSNSEEKKVFSDFLSGNKLQLKYKNNTSSPDRTLNKKLHLTCQNP